MAWLLGPAWFRMFQNQVSPEVGRKIAIIYLNGLLVGYALGLTGSVGVIGSVLVIRMRTRRETAPRRRRQARLLALGATILISLLVLDAGAAAWRAWLSRRPRLPEINGSHAPASTEVPMHPFDAVVPELPSQFAAGKVGSAAASGPLRILVIGESSARGVPYDPWLSVGQIVGWKLESVFPDRPIQVETWAKGGANLAQMHNRLADLTYRPDVLIVYVGHNEFQSRYPWMRDPDSYYLDEIRSLYAPKSLTGILRYSAFCRLVMETSERQRVSLRPPRRVTRRLVDRPVCTAAEAARILADFRARLDAIAAYCETIETLGIFIIPASNDGDYDPSRSYLSPDTPVAERMALARSVAMARARETNDPAAAMQIDREVVARHPEFAETHFRLARLLEQRGEWDEARRHYVEARDRDGMPMRCPEGFRQAYRDVADKHPAVLLVDGPRVLEAASPHDILNDGLFHDGQHPNLRGYVALAQDLLDQLCRRHALGWPAAVEAPRVDAEACARHFALDATRWASVCRREWSFYHVAAYTRYDPKYRNERAVDYLHAAEAIEAGRPPAEAGIPSGALPPRPARPPRVIPSMPADQSSR